MLTFIKKALTVRLASGIAERRMEDGLAVPMIHEPAFMRDVFRTANSSSGKITIVG